MSADDLPRVAILLPTYNGAKYLRAQIDSLLAQTSQNFVIVTRDDGSSDDSVAIIAQYALDHPAQFHVVTTDGNNLGACGSFSFLMGYVMQRKNKLGMSKMYTMCCDQDDVWYPQKIALSLQHMSRIEAEHPDVPVLVHSDLQVVDENMQEIAPSFVAYQGLNPSNKTFGRMLISNSVTGCTALINEELAMLAMPVPEKAIMHDWWLALVASAFGEMKFIPESLVHYRQHQANTIGAKEFRRNPMKKGFIARLMDNEHEETAKQLAAQARTFKSTYAARLSFSRRRLLNAVAMLGSRIDLVRNFTLKLLHKLLR